MKTIIKKFKVKLEDENLAKLLIANSPEDGWSVGERNENYCTFVIEASSEKDRCLEFTIRMLQNEGISVWVAL